MLLHWSHYGRRQLIWLTAKNSATAIGDALAAVPVTLAVNKSAGSRRGDGGPHCEDDDYDASPDRGGFVSRQLLGSPAQNFSLQATKGMTKLIACGWHMNGDEEAFEIGRSKFYCYCSYFTSVVRIQTVNSCKLYMDTSFSVGMTDVLLPVWCVHRSPLGIALASNVRWWRGLNQRLLPWEAIMLPSKPPRFLQHM